MHDNKKTKRENKNIVSKKYVFHTKNYSKHV